MRPTVELKLGRPQGRWVFQAFLALTAILSPGSGSCASGAPPPGVAAGSAAFDWFAYEGHDAVFDTPLPKGAFRNPILAGFFPDPSVTRVGDRYYLVNSTFTYFPGIPVFESPDLVHWRQIGNVIDRPDELHFNGLSVSRGVFAPSIQYHAGTYYVLNTAVDAGGNFLSIATQAAGPWSDPIWLPDLDGIDPSLFFDDDGRAYLLNNGPPAGKPRYNGHRAIWIQEFDLALRKLVGPRQVLVDGGVAPARNPIWIEGPHLYKRRGWYYLMCAEGGTSTGHSEVILRARSPFGPFMAGPHNPILTQRDLAPNRTDPVADAGHADLVETVDGRWWAVFLAVRPYAQEHYNTGRETFLLPVDWENDWPVILAQGQSIPYVASAPTSMPVVDPSDSVRGYPMTGNFAWRDEFDAPALQREWLSVRAPAEGWADLGARPGWLTIHARPESLDTLKAPSFLARRQQHMSFDASTALELPATGGVAAGIAAFQNERFWYFLGARLRGNRLQIFLEKDGGHGASVVTSKDLDLAGISRHRIQLEIRGLAGRYSFLFDPDGKGWRPLLLEDDGTILSTNVAGGFVGAVVGPFARVEGGQRK